MNCLFAKFQGGGNIPLIAPVAAELVRRGHNVRALVGPGIRPDRLPVSEGLRKRLADSGVEIVEFREPAPHPLEGLPPPKGLIGRWSPGAGSRPIPDLSLGAELGGEHLGRDTALSP